MSEKKPDDLRISSVPPFGLRMLPELRAKIERAAAESGRSMNSEIIARLEESFAADDQPAPRVIHHVNEDPEALLDKIRELLAAGERRKAGSG